MRRPAPGAREEVPRRPTKRLQGPSATRTWSPTTLPRVVSSTRTVRWLDRPKSEPSETSAQLLLPSLNQDEENNHKEHARDDADQSHIIHLAYCASLAQSGLPAYLKSCSRLLLILMTAGARSTMNIIGKINN